MSKRKRGEIMRKIVVSLLLISVLVVSAYAFGGAPPKEEAAKYRVTLVDPTGDDDGPGTYTYPTDPVYVPGSFDLAKVDIEDAGDNVIFKVSVNAPISNPWGMASDFSVQMVEIYIDTDHVSGSGYTNTMAGIDVVFSAEEAWDKCVMISPQPISRVKDEVTSKSKDLAAGLVVPATTVPSGATLIATVRKADLGTPQAGWGYQALVQSNEGFPNKDVILARMVNEYNGQHRFGGGSDYRGDPQVMDMLVSPAMGGSDEISKQHAVLSKYTADEDTANIVYAVVPMVYPAASK
jgi:carbohydrate-binding DOMON domain-containing protein